MKQYPSGKKFRKIIKTVSALIGMENWLNLYDFDNSTGKFVDAFRKLRE